MSVDLTTVPWNRLAKLAPPGTKVDELQDAADRWSLRADLYAAAADLWEEAALAIDTDCSSSGSDTATPSVASVSQDGISVTYATDPLAGNGTSALVAKRGQMLATSRRLRARAKASTPLVHRDTYDAWTGKDTVDDEQIIVVDEV